MGPPLWGMGAVAALFAAAFSSDVHLWVRVFLAACFVAVLGFAGYVYLRAMKTDPNLHAPF